MELDGIFSGNVDAPVAINCCSMGNLYKGEDLTLPLNGSGYIARPGSTTTIINSYFLNGIEGTTGLTAHAGETIFYKTSNDPEVMTTATVVDALNAYIVSNSDNIDTTGWCQWIVGDNNLPALDFTKEWNGTAWVTVSD